MVFWMPEPGQKANYVHRHFDAIARRYDCFNDLITQGRHRHWKRTLVGALGLQPGMKTLDLCAGTGDLTRLLARRVGPQGQVVGLDFSANMLSLAQRRLRRLPQAALVRGDALHLPFADGHFDAITVGFGLRNLADIPQGLREIKRVLAPGGCLGLLDLGKPEPAWLKPLANLYFFQVVPCIGRILQPGEDMYQYLPESSRAFPPPEVLREHLLALGFADIRIQPFWWHSAVTLVARS